MALQNLRQAVVDALYSTSATLLPDVCVSYGLDPGTRDEAMSSKRTYVMRRLLPLPIARVLEVAHAVSGDYRDAGLAAALREVVATHPADPVTGRVLKAFDEQGVHAAWSRALERREVDPEGAMTSARTLLEDVCKHILHEAGKPPDDREDLPKLYRRVAEVLALAPDRHTEEVFKRVLGGCQSVVEGLGTLRNKLGDAHGRGPKPVKPAPRHATLAVNLAGAMATFLVETWAARR